MEANIYDLLSKLEEESFTKFAKSEEVELLQSLLSISKTWLEDSVVLSTPKEEFDLRKDEIDKQAKKIRFRKRQYEVKFKFIH